MSLEILKSNLQELSFFSREASDQGIHLVADPIRAQKIYSSKDLIGSLCHIFYKLASLFGYHSLKEQNLLLAKRFTYNLCQEQLTKALQALNCYRSYLEKRTKGQPLSPSLAKTARQSIAAWQEATQAIIKAIKSPELSVKIQNFYYPLTPLLMQHHKQLKSMARLVQLEALFKEDLPFPLIAKVLKQHPLQEGAEKASFRRFVSKIDKKKDACDLHFLNASLLTLADEMSLFNDTPDTIELGALEVALIENGCRLFASQDEIHLNKRCKIRYGERIMCAGSLYIVGAPLGRKPEGGSDNTHIYELLNSNHLLSIGPNRAFQRIKRHISKTQGCAVPIADVIAIDHKGRFAIVDRLIDPVKNSLWTSLIDLSPEDRCTATPLLNVCTWCVQQQKFPLNFKAENLMFNREGYLRSLKIGMQSSLDFNGLVDFILEVSNGNAVIYDFILKGCGLLDHPLVSFFTSVLRQALRPHSLLVADIAVACSVSDPAIIKRGEQFFANIKQLKNQCYDRAVNEVAFRSYTHLHQKIAQAISACFTRAGPVGIIPQGIESAIMDELRNSFS